MVVPRMSVLQLALPDRVYILDMLALPRLLLGPEGWKDFADTVFNSHRRIIVGLSGILWVISRCVRLCKHALDMRTYRNLFRKLSRSLDASVYAL